MAADVALLTERRYTGPAAAADDWYHGNILRDDELLQAGLGRLGLSSARVDWADPDIDWTKIRCAVFRTTWDYFHRFDEFSAWLRQVERKTRLLNEPAIVWWNLDKHYLADLETRGIPIVPTRFVERGCRTSLRELLDDTGWHEAVIKPCISGSARHTYRFRRDDAERLQPVVDRLLDDESLMLQPFVEDIVRSGETTLVVIDGQCTHAVRKTPRAGDFRVQDDHGGTVHLHVPATEEVALAERAMAACAPAPLYGRVDMVRGNDGHLAVMELELIEPELWLRNHPPAASRLAAAIARVLS